MKKENSFEILRCIACINVIVLHLASVYIRADVIKMTEIGDYNIACFFLIISNLGVPTFVMLSGAFNIKKENIDSIYFGSKIVKRICIPTIIFSMVYVIFDYVKIILATILQIEISAEKMNCCLPLIKLLAGKPGEIMWYMFMMIPMFIITPIICLLKERVSKKWWIFGGCGLLLYSYIVSLTCSLSWVLMLGMNLVDAILL